MPTLDRITLYPVKSLDGLDRIGAGNRGECGFKLFHRTRR
jgi:hypothetical protein